eukprot:TRINITY_DN40305_c0_g1_i1.p1 TRINITY_DN40305_c0_g1~~TRINITY_DN40305_c0_g1_i1.p1  ORF type:complete len:290 (-),score=39.83 TRINITY_DN40305_c0_g1_i1:159-1028(-)
MASLAGRAIAVFSKISIVSRNMLLGLTNEIIVTLCFAETCVGALLVRFCNDSAFVSATLPIAAISLLRATLVICYAILHGRLDEIIARKALILIFVVVPLCTTLYFFMLLVFSQLLDTHDAEIDETGSAADATILCWMGLQLMIAGVMRFSLRSDTIVQTLDLPDDEKRDVDRDLSRHVVTVFTRQAEDASVPGSASAFSDLCCICLDEIAVGERVAMLPCLHAFHEECMTSWASSCRSRVLSKICPLRCTTERSKTSDMDKDNRWAADRWMGIVAGGGGNSAAAPFPD